MQITTKRDFRVGDLIETDPSKTTLGKGIIFQIEKILDQSGTILTTIVHHDNSLWIGEKIYIYKSEVRLVPIKSKFLRRPHLCGSA